MEAGQTPDDSNTSLTAAISLPSTPRAGADSGSLNGPSSTCFRPRLETLLTFSTDGMMLTLILDAGPGGTGFAGS